jgi:hypothetical protein
VLFDRKVAAHDIAFYSFQSLLLLPKNAFPTLLAFSFPISFIIQSPVLHKASNPPLCSPRDSQKQVHQILRTHIPRRPRTISMRSCSHPCCVPEVDFIRAHFHQIACHLGEVPRADIVSFEGAAKNNGYICSYSPACSLCPCNDLSESVK